MCCVDVKAVVQYITCKTGFNGSTDTTSNAGYCNHFVSVVVVCRQYNFYILIL